MQIRRILQYDTSTFRVPRALSVEIKKRAVTSIYHCAIEDMDRTLRNRLYNAVHKFLEPSPFINDELKYVVDKLGYRVEETSQKNWHWIDTFLQRTISDIPWYMPYEIIELFFEAKRDYCSRCEYDCYERGACDEIVWFKGVAAEINKIMEQEKFRYRFLNDKFVNITNEEELEEISKATESPLETNGVVIHNAIKAGFEKMYGYTSDSDGISSWRNRFYKCPSRRC